MADDASHITAGVESGYDKIADEYLAWVESRPSPRLRYIEKLFDRINTSTTGRIKVLELGCGAGVPVTKYLASHPRVGEIVANDLSSRQLELAKQRVNDGHANVTFLSGDMSNLNFDTEVFDGVVAFFTIFHLPRSAQFATLKKVHDWLKPGGVLVCNFGAGREGDKEKGEESKDAEWSSFFGASMYWEENDVNGSLALVREAGLEILEHEIKDSADGNQVLDPNDPDAGVQFLWIVAKKDV